MMRARDTTVVKRNRVLDAIVAIAAIGCALAALKAIRLGVPPNDFWLFPMLVVVPAVLALAFALSLFARPATRLNLVLLALSGSASLYLVEGALQALQPAYPPSREEAAQLAGRAFDTRDKAEVALEMRAAGSAAVGLVLPATTLRNPAGRNGVGVTVDGQAIAALANLAGRTLVNCNESGAYTMYDSDEHGFNNLLGVWSEGVDVAIIGDSFAVGACVAPADNVAARLRREGVRAVNAATVGAGPLSELGLLKEYVAAARPHDVFWFYYEWNDLHEMRGELEVSQLVRYLEPGHTQRLLERQPAIDSQLAAFTERQLADHVVRPPRTGVTPEERRSVRAIATEWVKLYRLRHTLGLAGIRERVNECCDLDSFRRIMVEADRTARSWGGRLHFVYLPAGIRYYSPMSALVNDAMRQRRRILRIARDLDLPIVDMDSTFRERGDARSMFYDDRSHFSVDGYRVTAAALSAYLKTLRSESK